MKFLPYQNAYFLLVIFACCILFSCSDNESSISKEDGVEEVRTMENNGEESSTKDDEQPEHETQKDSDTSQIENDALRFYSNLIDQMSLDQEYRLEEKSKMSFPSSLAEDLEGGAIIPHVIEITSKGGVVGLITFKEQHPYPLTFAMALPVVDDGFTLPVVHYEVVDINHTPVLRVIRSISGLLTEGPFQQAYYNMRGQGKGVKPMHISTGELMTDEDKKAVGHWIVHSKFPAGSYSQDCPPGLNEGVAKNVQLEFRSTGILAKTEFTGFSTNFFYYFTSDSTMTCWPLEKYMISPDDERIEEEISHKQQKASWKKIKFPGANVIELTSSSNMLPSSYFCY